MIDARIGEMAARLQASSIRLQRIARREAGDDAIGGPRLSALSFVARIGPVSLAALAAAEQVRAPTMTRIVDSLVDDGLVTRTADPADRRAVRIAVTGEGARLLDGGTARRADALVARLAALADSERRALYRGVELIERMLR